MKTHTLKIQENEKLHTLHTIGLHMIRDTNYYFLMREFTYHTENYNEKLRKHGPCKVDLWMHETEVLSLPPSLQNITPLIYFSFDSRSKKSIQPPYSFIVFALLQTLLSNMLII